MIATLALLVTGVQRAAAHPHVWIDMTVTAVFDADGKVSAFRHVWTFDEFYSVFQLEALEGREPTPDVLSGLADEMLASIAGLGYLMKVETRDGLGRIASAGDPGLILRPDGRLELRFTARLADPVDVRAWPLRYAVFDPEYYIEMLHVKETGTLMSGQVPPQCTMDLQRPAPTFEMLSLAAAVETMQEDAPPLGEAFAEKVTIDCRPPSERSAP